MLRGERVTLRGLTRDDLPRLRGFNNDLAVELAGGGDPPIPRSLERLQAEFDREAAKGGRDGADFAIEVAGLFVGRCGPMAIGDPEYRGRGYGREAVRLLLDDAFRLRNRRRVWLWAHADNARAIAAYRAAGFVEEGRLREHVWSNGRDVDAFQMGVLGAEWPGA